jgi:hypothetical protein
LWLTGVGGKTDYLYREICVRINDQTLTIPVASILDENELKFIIGRVVVFDLFDITFRQSKEVIDFHFIQK